MNAPPKVEPRIEPPPLTYADQLRPLVEAVASRALTIPEKARLELLLYQYWKERIQEHASEWRTLIPKLRIHPEAGPLITTIERWLHDRPRSTTRRNDPSNRSKLCFNPTRDFLHRMFMQGSSGGQRIMTFVHPWVLFLLIVPILLAAWLVQRRGWGIALPFDHQSHAARPWMGLVLRTTELLPLMIASIGIAMLADHRSTRTQTREGTHQHLDLYGCVGQHDDG